MNKNALIFFALLILVLCVSYAFKYLKPIAIIGGYDIVPVKFTEKAEFVPPEKIEYIDEVTGQPKTWDPKGARYVPPSSDQQIEAIIKHGGSTDYGNLVALIGKFYKGPTGNIPNIIRYKKDSDVYAIIKKSFSRQRIDTTMRDNNQAIVTFKQIQDELVDKKIEPVSIPEHPVYLDIGCNRGDIAHKLGTLLKATRICGIDVIEHSNPNIEYHQLRPNPKRKTTFPFDNNTFDIITAMMVLHHLEDIKQYVSEIVRVLKPGGILFIKEHDCWSAMDVMLVEIEHELYNITGSDHGEYGVYHHMNYYQWDETLKPLKYVIGNYFYPRIKPDISPSRAFWTVLVKPQ
jgi:SAM-dependent methyltransferase